MPKKRSADDVPAEVATLETREAPPSHFLMKVESFSLLGEKEIHKYESGEFTAGGHKWRLILYPNEDKVGIDSKHISLHLAISQATASSQPKNWEVNVVFSIFLLNQITGNYHYSGRIQRFQAMKSEWGISKFISRKILMDPLNGFLIDNNCVFGAEIFILEKSAMSECLSVKDLLPYTRDWKISNFSKLGDQWTSEQFCVGGVTWEVKVFPKGNGSEKGRHVGVFLGLIDYNTKRVKACFSICIKDQLNNNIKGNEVFVDSHWFSPTSDDWGCNDFIELATLNDPKNGFIVEDCCHLEIELSVQAVI